MSISFRQAWQIFDSSVRQLERADGGLTLAGCPHCGEFQTRETYVTGFWKEEIELLTDYICKGISLCKCGKWSHWIV